jgi:hypothetical protein
MTEATPPTPHPDGTEITPRESRRLATGLIVYGSIGVLLAIASIVAMFVLDSRLGSVDDAVSGRVDTLQRTLKATSDSLDSAATSASGFSVTLGETSAALGSVSEVLAGLGPVLRSVGNIAGLLGQSGFGQVGDSLADLAPELEAMSTNLVTNQAQLETTSTKVAALADQLDEVEAVLAEGIIEKRVDQGFGFLRAGIIALTIWIALPAAAALFIGIWLRRAVSPAG